MADEHGPSASRPLSADAPSRGASRRRGRNRGSGRCQAAVDSAAPRRGFGEPTIFTASTYENLVSETTESQRRLFRQYASSSNDFDVIIVGSGIGGGIL